MILTQDIQFQIECLAAELTEMLMAEFPFKGDYILKNNWEANENLLKNRDFKI